MCVFSLPSDGYRGVSLICSSVTLAFFVSYFGLLEQSSPICLKAACVIQKLNLKSGQRNPNHCRCRPLHYLHAHICLCGGRESSSQFCHVPLFPALLRDSSTAQAF